ncbi:hypothetical protein ASZ90_011176 [hydrocarbon metagenome]|uniref:Uncharacterized protein n=1 Tax=hydrocarbon metagenome TaxID=938273 RepID=A0A0W8FE39_9ZZZZ
MDRVHISITHRVLGDDEELACCEILCLAPGNRVLEGAVILNDYGHLVIAVVGAEDPDEDLVGVALGGTRDNQLVTARKGCGAHGSADESLPERDSGACILHVIKVVPVHRSADRVNGVRPGIKQGTTNLRCSPPELPGVVDVDVSSGEGRRIGLTGVQQADAASGQARTGHEQVNNLAVGVRTGQQDLLAHVVDAGALCKNGDGAFFNANPDAVEPGIGRSHISDVDGVGAGVSRRVRRKLYCPGAGSVQLYVCVNGTNSAHSKIICRADFGHSSLTRHDLGVLVIIESGHFPHVEEVIAPALAGDRDGEVVVPDNAVSSDIKGYEPRADGEADRVGVGQVIEVAQRLCKCSVGAGCEAAQVDRVSCGAVAGNVDREWRTCQVCYSAARGGRDGDPVLCRAVVIQVCKVVVQPESEIGDATADGSSVHGVAGSGSIYPDIEGGIRFFDEYPGVINQPICIPGEILPGLTPDSCRSEVKVLWVTHNNAASNSTCTKVIVLDQTSNVTKCSQV